MDWEESRNAARNYIERAGTEDSDTFLANVKDLARQLRDDREFDLLDYFTEELKERAVDDAELIKFQASSTGSAWDRIGSPQGRNRYGPVC
jgi:hypothetical protein